MGPDEDERDLTAGRRRRRRAVMAVLATAAIAIPGLALAAGGGGSSGPATPQPSEYESPAFNTQGDEGKRGRHDGRDCPYKRRGRERDASERRL
jgi:hypothetical protein